MFMIRLCLRLLLGFVMECDRSFLLFIVSLNSLVLLMHNSLLPVLQSISFFNLFSLLNAFVLSVDFILVIFFLFRLSF